MFGSLRTVGLHHVTRLRNTIVKYNAAKLSGSRETPIEKHSKLSFPSHFTCTYTTYTTRRLPKLFFEAFSLFHLTKNQPTCEWLGRMMVLRTDTRPCVMCVDARRYGCTAEMLAYTTHEQRYLGSNPRAWLEGGLHHKSNLRFLCADTLPSCTSLLTNKLALTVHSYVKLWLG